MEAPALALVTAVSEPPAEEAAPAPAAPAAQPSWTAWLLAPDARPSLRREAVRLAAGFGLASIYGAALGTRAGGGALAVHALGVPAALLAAFGLGTPALYIALAISDAPVEPQAAAAAASRGVATAGLVLAGFAPAAALFVVSSERPGAAALAAGAGLAAGIALGLRALLGELWIALAEAPPATRGASGAAFAGFVVFAAAVAGRVAAVLLSVLGGAR
jgi:hypothetical protein